MMYAAREPGWLRRGAGLLLSFSVCGLWIGLPGCSDKRISYEQFRDMQASLEAKEPVKVSPGQLALSEVQKFRAQPGDVLKLTLIGLDTGLTPTTVNARVNPAGEIRLPMVDTLNVRGKTLSEIEQAIIDAYVPNIIKKNLTAYAEVEEATMISVIVNGAAGQRGLVNLRSDKRNLLYALVQSQGFIKSASGVVHVRPARPELEATTYDLNDINDLRLAMMSPPLESGDMITVEPGELAAIYVTGLVNEPGALVIEPGSSMTVMQAIAAGSGLVDFLDPKEATLWRRMKNGERVGVKLALADIMKGKADDVPLYAGDILDVPQTPTTRFRQWLAENVQIGPIGITATYDPLADRRAKLLRDNNNGGNGFQRLFLNTFQSAIPALIVSQSP